VAIAFIIALWKIASLGVGLEIILPSPERVIKAIAGIASNRHFTSAVGATALRGLSAFGISMFLGLGLGLASGASRRFEGFMAPGITVIRATPVLAVILIALIWFPSGIVPVFSAVIMAFPVVAADVAAGVRSTDQRLIDMARSFGVSRRQALVRVRLPSAMPHVVSAARNAVGLCWKVVIAGEVLSQPVDAVGTGMQGARIMLETAEVFAWAAVGVFLCAVSDGLFEILARRLAWPTK
jgi:NitT/TauT family transport system permease protein